MKDRRKTEIRVGITVVAGILIFIWILGWAKNFSLTSDQKVLRVKFESVSGLEIGDYVTVNGVRKGVVEEFNVQSNNVIVSLSLDEDVQLKQDAKFVITMLDLMGGKKVNIKPGNSAETINYEEIQEGIFYADIPEVMAMVGNIEGDIPEIVRDIKITVKSLNSYLTDYNFSEDIKTSVSNLSDATRKLNVMIDENKENINQLTSGTVQLTENLNEFFESNKESLSESARQLKAVLSKTDSLLAKANAFSDEIKNGNNNLGKLLYDEEILSNLNQSLSQLNELTRILIEQLNGGGVNVDANIF